MFTRSPGRFMEGQPNFNVRSARGGNGKVVVERQARSLWGTPFGKWQRDTSKGNHKKARNHVNRKHT